MSKMIEQTTGNALLRCNITVSTRKNKNVLKKTERKKTAIVNIFTEDFYEALFLSSSFEMYPPCILHFFVCCSSHWSGWLDVRGDSDSASLKGKHKTLLFSVTVHFSAAIFSLVF